jgi:hypothetical protein
LSSNINFFLRLLVCLLICGLASSQVDARCYFLECEPGDSKVPPPPPTAAPVPAPPARAESPPARQATSRPSGPYESCASVSGIIYCASSVLSPQYGFTYGPEQLTDGRLDTAWVPGQGANGDGIGEWIVADFPKRLPISSLQVLNGYHKNAGIFARNNRVRDLEIISSEGERKLVRLADDADLQTIALDFSQDCKWIQLIIRSVYRGQKYRDTAISELRVEH